MSTKIRALLSHRIIFILASIALITCGTFAAFTLTSTRTPAHAQAPSQAAASVPSSCYNLAVLSYGSTDTIHAYVRFLQTHLNGDYQAGRFPNSPYNFHPLLAVDGSFGALTENAVKDIQTRYHVAVDGIVGPITWNLVDPGCGVP